MTSLDILLAQNPVFASLNAAERAILGQQAIPKRYQKGEIIAHAGRIWPYLLLVAEGTVNAVKESSEGRSLIIATFGAGNLFWGLAFFQDGLSMPVTLEACESTLIYLWQRDKLMPFLLERGKVSLELCGMMANMMQKASKIVDELAFQPVAGRLARLLVDHFSGTTSGRVNRDLTLDEMAARIGTTREMVCRILYRFSDSNLIEVTRTEFALKDRAGLEHLAE